MIIRDPFGAIIEQGDIVAFSLSTGNIVPAKLSSIQTLIPNQPPTAVFTINVPITVDNNGFVGGVILVKKAETQKVLEG